MVSPVALVIAEDVHQDLPGGVHALLGDGFQLIPGEDDIVAVHQQIFFPAGKTWTGKGLPHGWLFFLWLL